MTTSMVATALALLMYVLGWWVRGRRERQRLATALLVVARQRRELWHLTRCAWGPPPRGDCVTCLTIREYADRDGRP